MESPPPLARRLSRPLGLLTALPAMVLAAIQIHWVWPFFSDDSFISLRYAARLLSGEGLTWTDGERVEGYSNLLWVLLVAGLGSLGIDLVLAARLLGMAATAGTLWLLAVAARPRNAGTALLAALAPLVFAGTTQVMGWTAGGLEGPLATFLIVWGMLAALDLRERHENAAGWSFGALVRCGAPFALLALCRPDGPLWAATVGLALGLGALPLGFVPAATRVLAFASLPLGAFASQGIFRWFYYGDWVPNTAHVKVDPGTAAFSEGFCYVTDALWTVQGLTWLALLAAIWLLGNRRGRRAVPLLVLPLAAWLCYLVFVGGDHFPGYRLMHPALAPLALLVAWTCRHLATSRLTTLLAVGLATAAAIANVALSRTEPLSVHLRAEKWEWQGKLIGEVLGRALAKQQPRIAVDAAGAVPYYSRLPALDMLGLCDRTIAKSEVPEWADIAATAGGLVRKQGHLRGNGAYVMDQAPDMMQFMAPPGMPLPVFVSGLQMERDPRFLDGYRLIVLDLDGSALPPGLPRAFPAFLWVRVEGRAGVVRETNRIEIPVMLLGAYRLRGAVLRPHRPPADAAEHDAQIATMMDLGNWAVVRRPVAVVAAQDGALELLVKQPDPLVLELELPAGAWRVVVEPADRGFVGTAADGRVTIDVTAATLPATIRRVTLVR